MLHVEPGAEALMARRQQMFDGFKEAASIRLIITGVASTGTRPEPMLGAVCSSPTMSSAVPVRAGFNLRKLFAHLN